MECEKMLNKISSVMFGFVTDFKEDELDRMAPREFNFHHRVYDIYMILAVFWAGTYGGARIYEAMSMTAIGIIPPNIIQLSPLFLGFIIFMFMGYAGILFRNIKDLKK